MSVKQLVYLIMAVCTGAALLVSTPVCGEEEETMKYSVIRLLSDSIEPSHAVISQGTVIIWLNEAQETAEITFAQDIATCLNGSPPVNSRTEQEMSFRIEFGRTESICLVQKGKFNYSVKRGSKNIAGTIEIR